ncbi:PREDICTED: uncharacterized protein LOC108360722 [Rhagoletis zephyria]|uniref:uncharacterized protein LOC108360722 n=1 Tax=Rhagoletis zephyria TaxID=28612 RepID=UPI0008114E13|nr:PREDICTED: uncharacterized protein LOC108360722 [Rhagoletis zephyria]
METSFLTAFKSVEVRLTAVEKALHEKMPEKAEVQAQSKILRESKVVAARTHNCINRVTGDMEDEEYIELSSKFPLSSEEELLAVETKLQNKASVEVLMRLLIKAKGFKGGVDGVLRALLRDDLVANFNLEGRKNKKALLKLKCMDIIFDVFADQRKEDLVADIRKYVALSHNRFKQKKNI